MDDAIYEHLDEIKVTDTTVDVCQQCVEGRYNLCENYGVMDLHRQYGHNYQGADAEYVVHGVKCIFPLLESVSWEEGAVIDPASIALHVANRARIQPGDNVGIMGGGAIGLLGGEAAKIRGALSQAIETREAEDDGTAAATELALYLQPWAAR